MHLALSQKKELNIPKEVESMICEYFYFITTTLNKVISGVNPKAFKDQIQQSFESKELAEAFIEVYDGKISITKLLNWQFQKIRQFQKRLG